MNERRMISEGKAKASAAILFAIVTSVSGSALAQSAQEAAGRQSAVLFSQCAAYWNVASSLLKQARDASGAEMNLQLSKVAMKTAVIYANESNSDQAAVLNFIASFNQGYLQKASSDLSALSNQKS